MKHVCRRCFTAFSSQPVLIDHIDCGQRQQSTNISFRWKDQLKFKDYHTKVPVPIRVYADFECINQPESNPITELCNPNLFFKQISFAVGFYLMFPPGSLCVTPCENKYYSYFDKGFTGG